VREILLFVKRTLKRLDLTSRTLVALVEPGSCFAGLLAEILFAADRVYMLNGTFEDDNRPPATIHLTPSNFGLLPMSNGISRLATRFFGHAEVDARLKALVGVPLDATAAGAAGLVTFTPDDIDWHDEIRVFVEERASFSPDALTAMEANLRFGGPETLETKIFARLSAWQNWVFQRPNAVGDDGALKRYGSGQRPRFDKTRI
jgi:benzoyl-CoA-dihydrodiol lyase